MDKKKGKIGTPVWRPVCAQASSLEEPVMKDVMVESENGSQMPEVNEAVIEVMDATGSPKVLEDDIEDETLKEEPVLSAAKHSLSVAAVKPPSLDYSHFVSLPLAIHPELVDKLVNFQNSILGISDACVDENLEGNSDGDTYGHDQQFGKGSAIAIELKVSDDKKSVKVDASGIPLVSYAPKEPKESKSSNLSDLRIEKSIFIKPKTFHLTVLMLKLWNKERLNLAVEVLKSISSKVMYALDNRPLFVRLKGLDCMKGSLSSARVVYAPVEEIGSENRLSCACQVIIAAFVEAGLVLEKDARHELKLHATVMNVRHRERRGQRSVQFDSFDARGIFKQFGSEEWGEYLIREAHLSQIRKFDENGYYYCCASIPFPENMQAD